MNLPDPLTGELLKEAVFSPLQKRVAYAENLVYEKSSIMLSADPGTGKSIMALEAAVQFSAGLPLFGSLLVENPIKVYYIQKERPQLEVLERLNNFSNSIKPNWDNLAIDSSLQAVNLSDLRNVELVTGRIYKFKPQLVVIDPIGAGLGGLSDDKIANNFCSMLTLIQTVTDCSFWLNHHTTKPQYTKDGDKVEKEKPFYGSQWLDAFVTGHYHVTKSESGTNWRKTKDTYGLLLSKLQMEYEPDKFLSYLHIDGLQAKDKLLTYLNSVKSHKKFVLFNEMMVGTGVSYPRLRDTLNTSPFPELLRKVKSNGKATLYEFI